MHKTGRTFTISAALLGALLLPTVASEAQAGWTHRRTLTIDTTASGANVSGDVKGFPVPVRLDASNFDFGQAKPGGADIRFDDAAGAPLPYEIEKWDAAAKQAAIWVRIDVKGNARQTMTLKWGNPEASAESDGTKVFPKADGWVTAHHLAEKGAAAGYRDSAGNLNGKGVNITGDATGAGVVGNALSLNRSKSEYVLLPGSETSGLFNPLPSKGTFSVWSNAKTHPAAYIAMFSKGESGFRIHYFGEGDQTEPCVDVANYDWCPLPSGGYTKVKNNTWYHFVFVLDKPNAYYYINGKLEVGKTDTNAWKTAGTEPVTIGNNEKTAGGNSRKRSFDGLLDEARILSVPKDKNWAKLDFESQRPGSKLLK
ncbi:hypothetical protein UK23_47345 [Lentzea aerocolonigenes]|uniref:DUF2341 domain-containing protein n=1 Tax=Lentzea aerocolonigenes TaxID=68170 RepID=A0A0F0GA93_LENAE|nr:DUF2341 domain-containing protein [Lentzea aerocolonigenes]KJK33150.1 hypothetical protein UK23_47345 [Lentzea aerocolonigenes]